jgi:hypothetical protein
MILYATNKQAARRMLAVPAVLPFDCIDKFGYNLP